MSQLVRYPALSGRSGGEAITMDTTRSIDARSIVTLIFFILINVLVIYPIYIPLPLPVKISRLLPHGDETEKTSGWTIYRFKIGLETAPVIGVLLLLASTCIPGSVVRKGIVGSDGVKPYNIMTLFLCFAYISLSLDSTGLLRYLAFLVGNKYSSSGSRLYSAFYAFFALTGLLIGNDPLILSGTPFLVYFTDHASIQPPTGFLFTHFQVSNLVSALLVSSNPTNLVLTSSFNISFLKFSAWTALPTVAAVIVLYPIARYFVFKDYVPKRLSPPHVRAKDALNDRWGGIFGAVLFAITIVLLVGLSAGGKLEEHPWGGVWIVVLPAALCMLTWDSVGDLRDPGRKDRARLREKEGMKEVLKPGAGVEAGEVEERENENEKAGAETTPADTGKRSQSAIPDEPSEGNDTDRQELRGMTTMLTEKQENLHSTEIPSEGVTAERQTSDPVEMDVDQARMDDAPSNPAVEETDANTLSPSSTPPVEKSTQKGERDSSTTVPSSEGHSPFNFLARRFPTPIDTLSRMPWPLVPFAFSMFIIVEGLQYTGWMKVFGGWWAAWVRADSTGVAGVVWLMGMLSVIGCNAFGTNIGATILLSRVLQYWQQTHGPVSERTLYAAVYTLAVGSNFGAYSFVFSASLAGLLWRTILRQKGRTVTQIEFAKFNWVAVCVTMVVGCLIVAGEVCVIYKG